jgi:GNAT superfamily N-acetyltransferase
MIVGTLSAEALREKRSPPRALEPIAGALYARPLEGASSAWLAWLPDDAAVALDAVIERAHRDGARTLTVGGPPGNYLASGVDPEAIDLCEMLAAKGFRETGRHLDLTVSTAGHGVDARVERAVDGESLGWIASSFARAWAMEAERALAHGGLYVVRDGASWAGFACHSGNRAWEATFGPIGVMGAHRGGGLGRRLASAALAGLAARGFEEARVPWVDVDTARFYESFCAVRDRVWRAEYRMVFARGGD